MYVVYYIYYLLLGGIVKIVNPIWYFIIVPYRARARAVVYKYVTDNNIYIKDLRTYGGYKYIIDEKIPYYKYFWYKWTVWVWLNDRAADDTTDHALVWGYIYNKNIDSKRVAELRSIDFGSGKYGPSFKEGTRREMLPVYNTKASMIYLSKVSDSNFDYMYYITNNPDKVFYFNIGSWEFGWKPSKSTLGGLSFHMCFFKSLIDN